ncbi:MAG TPA: hypothetical protein VFA29_14895 [Candidatus Baltobacteraceae bacterium]|nr:hypothetical protein [Candidatus Baltobacteraceae bacterium]
MVRLAATVMLVRPAKHAGLEVYMLRRSEASHFVPDVYVFPGGALEAADMSAEMLARTRGIDEPALQAQFRIQPSPSLPAPHDAPTPREAAGLLVAGVRELFEEAGVLLACRPSGEPLTGERMQSIAAVLEAARPEVAQGRMRFDELLGRLDLQADARALTLFSQWITPPVYPRRYNAHFFVAIAGEDQAAAADALETHDGVWIAPHDALEACSHGTFSMVYPTIKHVERLAQFADTDSLLGFARTKAIYSVMPQTPGAHQFALPAELEYAW